jgi:D-3-phosphoglycerate dehydrogenase
VRILIASRIDPATVARLEDEHDVVACYDASEQELIAAVSESEVLIFRSGVQITAEVMAASTDLRLLIRGGSGLDNLDLSYATERGLELVRIPEPGAKAVAELAFAFMLALARDLFRADRLTRAGEWPKHQLSGRLLTGKTLGVVGYGNIGSRTGRLGAAWGMKVLGARDPNHQFHEVDVGEDAVELVALDELLIHSDFVSVHVPLMTSTCGLLGVRELGLMKEGSYLVNLSRGGVVDEEALLEALTNPGGLAGAATDVHTAEGPGKISPLVGLDNTIMTPHIGAMALEVQAEIGTRILELVDQYSMQKEDGT